MNITEAQKLFKDNIKSIEIGMHNYCNRTCNFCPLSRDDVNGIYDFVIWERL